MHLIGLDIDPKIFKCTKAWMDKCKIIKGNKEVANLYMNDYKKYRESYGYDKDENFSTS